MTEYQRKIVKDAVDKGDFTLDGLPPQDIDLEKALLCAEMSTLCYRNNRSWNPLNKSTKETWQSEVDKVARYAKVYGYKSKVFSTHMQQGAVFYNDHNIVVAFEGSNMWQLRHYNRNLASYFRSWFEPTGAEFDRKAHDVEHERILKEKDELIADGLYDEAAQERIGKKLEFIENEKAKVHLGFSDTLDHEIVSEEGVSLWDAVKRECKALYEENPSRTVYFTGHSSGGALASIAASRMVQEEPKLHIDGLYTYGQPRVGNSLFRAGLEHKLRGKYFRFDQYGDPMPALPPYREEEYVHAGQWIPMDADGHVLVQRDENGFPITRIRDDHTTKDTFTDANQLESTRISMAYSALKTATDAARAVVGSNSVLADMIDPVDAIAKGTHASLRGLFSRKNFDIHSIRNYSTALHLLIASQIDRGDPDLADNLAKDKYAQAVRLNETLKTHAGNNLIYTLYQLEDSLKERGVAVPKLAADGIRRLETRLNEQLRRWDELSQNHPQDVFPPSGPIENSQAPQKAGIWTKVVNMVSGLINSEEELQAGVEATRQNRSFRAARTSRSMQRVRILNGVEDTLNQFRHDVEQARMQNPHNWFLQTIAEQAEQCYVSIREFRTLSPQFDAAKSASQAR